MFNETGGGSVAHRISPLLVAAACLLGANGLSMTMIAVRGRAEGLADGSIGLLGSFYYAGMIAGVLFTPWLVARAGHIRVFAAFASFSAISVLAIAFLPPGWSWMLTRLVSGIAFCGTAMVLESWLNAIASNQTRGRILSIYRIVDLGAATGGQFILPVFGASGPDILMVLAVLFCFSLVPISLSRSENPQPPSGKIVNPLLVWKVSPLVMVGVLTIGLTNGAFRMVGPIYAESLGLGLDLVAAFIALWVFAGAVFQYPAGWLSDRIDRRVILAVFTGAAGGACVLISGATNDAILFTGVFLFGGFALPLYSLLAAHANDHAESDQFLDIAAGLTLVYGVGAVFGPLIASMLMEAYGPAAFFVYTATLHLSLVGFVVFRIFNRAPVPATKRHRFVWLLRHSPVIFRLAGGTRGSGTPESRESRTAPDAEKKTERS